MATASVTTADTRPHHSLTYVEMERLDKLCLWIDAVADVTGAASVVGDHHCVADDAILNATWLIREMATEVRAILGDSDARVIAGLADAVRAAPSGREAQA